MATAVVSSVAPLEGIIHLTGSPERVAKLTWLLLRVAKCFHVQVELGSKSIDDWPIFDQDGLARREAPLALKQLAVEGEQIET
jgi:hypothetical protein